MTSEKPAEPAQPDKGRSSDTSTEERSMLELRFPSDIKFLHMVRDLAHRLAEGAGFDSEEAGKIAMAVDEATTNVIERAYHGAQDREIEIHFDVEGESLDIQILHDGDAHEEVPLPSFDLDKLIAERRKDGLGIYIMRHVMDDSNFGKAGSGKNMCVVVRYKRRPAKGD